MHARNADCALYKPVKLLLEIELQPLRFYSVLSCDLGLCQRIRPLRQAIDPLLAKEQWHLKHR